MKPTFRQHFDRWLSRPGSSQSFLIPVSIANIVLIAIGIYSALNPS